jgi:cell division septum initiation protein DivIVA
MKTKLFIAVVTLGVVTLFSSCNKVPQAEIDAANVAVDSAKAVDAEHYAPEAYTAIQDTLKSALEQVEVQKSKMFGKYTAIKEKLAYVTSQASVVKQQAITRKAEMKVESDTLMAEVKALLDENKELIKKAPKGKEGKAALEAINAEITEIEAALTDATTLYNSGSYFAVVDKLKVAKEKSVSIKDELTAAISKTKKK